MNAFRIVSFLAFTYLFFHVVAIVPASASVSVDMVTYIKSQLDQVPDDELWFFVDTISPLEVDIQKKGSFIVRLFNTISDLSGGGKSHEVNYTQFIQLEDGDEQFINRNVILIEQSTDQIRPILFDGLLGQSFDEDVLNVISSNMRNRLPKMLFTDDGCYTYKGQRATAEVNFEFYRTGIVHTLVYEKINCFSDISYTPNVPILSCKQFVEKYGATRSNWYRYQIRVLEEFPNVITSESFVNDCDSGIEPQITAMNWDFPSLPSLNRLEFELPDWSLDDFALDLDLSELPSLGIGRRNLNTPSRTSPSGNRTSDPSSTCVPMCNDDFTTSPPQNRQPFIDDQLIADSGIPFNPVAQQGPVTTTEPTSDSRAVSPPRFFARLKILEQ